MRKIIAILLTFVLALGIAPAFAGAATAINFTDLKNSHWAYKNINTLVSKGGISGYPDGTFKPGGEITHAEFIKIVVGSTIGEQSVLSTDKHWASGYIAKALEKGIIKEGELEKNGQTKNAAGLKAWDWQISRDYMAVIIARTLENVLKEDLTVKNQTEIENSILDYPGLCDYCKQSIVAVYNKGIVTGYPNNEFMGWKRATRAEAATMLVRMIEPNSRAAVKILNVVKVGDPKDLINGKWAEERNISATLKYTILSSAEPYKLALGERNGTKWIESEGLNRLYLMKDGEIIEMLQAGDVGFYKSDITTVDYLMSASSTTKAIILIPNPFKK